jgi:hypothetical protein
VETSVGSSPHSETARQHAARVRSPAAQRASRSSRRSCTLAGARGIDGDIGTGKRQLGGFDGATQVGREHSRDRLLASPLTKLSGKLAPLLRQGAWQPTRGNAALIVRADRVCLEHYLDAHGWSMRVELLNREGRQQSPGTSVALCIPSWARSTRTRRRTPFARLPRCSDD